MREPTIDELKAALAITECGTKALIESGIPESHFSIQARIRIAKGFQDMIKANDMTLREPPPKPTLAVIDGHGESAEVYLYASRKDLDDGKESLKWPLGWPKRVTGEFLKTAGCRVITT